ncbi:helix-turn-helix domain-containing protein [Blautia obeum]
MQKGIKFRIYPNKEQQKFNQSDSWLLQTNLQQRTCYA